jgi:hypothetical protein
MRSPFLIESHAGIGFTIREGMSALKKKTPSALLHEGV